VSLLRRRWALIGIIVTAALGAAGSALLFIGTVSSAGGPVTPGPDAKRHATQPASTQPPTTTQTGPAATTATTGSTTPTAVRGRPRLHRPQIVWKPIPFPAHRLAETAAYAQKHYGIDTWHLRHPHVIVEHYTASTTMQSAWSQFAQDVPDSELHELPGTCAHFIVDRDGTIYQLVPLDVICRHTVGLNATAIGIEHVGTSDAEILADPAQMRSSLLLTAWLMQRFHIRLGDVIGHSESLTSPYHHERLASWRCQTHSDWQHADMVTYRARLHAVIRRHGIAAGPAVKPVSSGC
jgi:N-acetylmuramoyl-L-alanine amidase